MLDYLLEDEIDYDYSDTIDDSNESLADVEVFEECLSNFAFSDEISLFFYFLSSDFIKC